LKGGTQGIERGRALWLLSKHKVNPLLLTLRRTKWYYPGVVSAYEELWGVAEDNFGIITSKRAVDLGVSRQCVRALAESGRLTRLGHGVYQVLHHVPNRLDAFAAAVAMVGETGYIRSASVIALLDLCPTNPGLMYVGAKGRVRRRLPAGYCLRDRQETCVNEYERIPCQRLLDAMREARSEGSLEGDRIADAARAAVERGLLTYEESAEFQG